MDEVGVRELKQHLSEHLDRVARGESVIVTDRGRPKAMIVPVPGMVDRLQEGIADGWIRPAAHGDGLAAVAKARGTARVLDVLDDDRG